jgi:hypothetical protein
MRSRLAFAAAIVTSACILLAAIIWLAQPEQQKSGIVEVFIGKIRLAVPSDYIRFEHARFGGRLPELDLMAEAASFRPVQAEAKVPVNEDTSSKTVFFTLTPAGGTLSPAERTTRLYARFLEADHWEHPGGLIMRRFQSGSPYQNEDLYIAPPEGRLFAARCPRPRNPPDNLPQTCLSNIRIDGIDIRVRFSATLLSDWRKLFEGTRGLVQSFRR